MDIQTKIENYEREIVCLGKQIVKYDHDFGNYEREIASIKEQILKCDHQIENYEREIVSLREKIAKCDHDFDELYRDFDWQWAPIRENRPIDSLFYNPVTIGWKKEEIQVWRRKCKKCGFKQTEPVF
jgi:predicted  nucleic acid-binding Zn-ribbon protein